MLTNIRVFFKQFKTHVFFTIIKVLSLAIGFTVFMVLCLMVMDDLGYDENWELEDKLFRVSMEQYQDGQLSFRSARSYTGLPGLLVEELPEVQAMTRLLPDVITVFVGEQQIQDVKMFYADTNVFDVLPRKILASESSRVFPDIHSMAISSSLAKKLYGTNECLGQELRLNEGWTFYISTVFEDIPQKSHLAFDILMSRASLAYYMRNFDNLTGQLVENEDFEYVDPGPYHRASWNNRNAYNYLLIKDGTDIEKLKEKTQKLIRRIELPAALQNASIIAEFQEVERIYLYSDYPDEMKENSSIYHIYMLLLIGLIVLVISWINFFNLYAVVFRERIKVTAIRMIHGAGARGIKLESFAMGCFLSLLGGTIALASTLVLDYYIQTFKFDSRLLLILFLLVLTTAFLSVLIPLSSVRYGKLMNQLKGELFDKQRKSFFRQIMMVIQFSSGMVLIACTLVIYLQMNYTRKKELGFNDQNIVYSFSPMTMNQRPDIPDKLAMFENEIMDIPGVIKFSASSSVPGQGVHFPSILLSNEKDGNHSDAYIHRISVDPDYFDLYEIDILSGRGFRDDDNYDVNEIILNRKAANDLGFSDPNHAVGETVSLGENTLIVVGVVENYHHLSLKDKLLPLAFFKSLWWSAAVGNYSIKLSTVDTQTLERISEVWTDIYPGEQYLYNFMDETYQDQYKEERDFSISFLLAAVLALVISCLGLLGLARFNILKRTKEIGIRKTFGSTAFLLVKLLQKETLILVLLSSIIGIPISLIIVRRWLENFSYRIEPAWWMFLSAIFVVLIVAISTTMVQVLRAVRMNPVDALHYE